VIVVPNHPAEWQALAGFLHQYAGVHPSADMRCIGWVSDEKAMRMDLHLGYHEIFRLPGMHEDGGDLIVLAMKKTECRYLDAQPESVAVAETGSA
jgi:hypothetical protein